MSFKAVTDRSLARALENRPKNYDGVNKLTYFGKILFVDQRDLQCPHIIYYSNGCSKPHVVQVGVNPRVGSPRIELGCSIYDLYIDHLIFGGLECMDLATNCFIADRNPGNRENSSENLYFFVHEPQVR